MREILFRGKCVDNELWITGFYFQKQNPLSKDGMPIKHAIANLPPFGNEVYPDTVGAFTGRTDKNGTKIFEGDICCFKEWENGEFCWIGEVVYENAQYVIQGGPNKECDGQFYMSLSRIPSDRIAVIGNVHDNPELLGKGTNKIGGEKDG